MTPRTNTATAATQTTNATETADARGTLTGSLETPPDDHDLNARFHPIFARIAQQSVQREAEHQLPHEQVRWLADAGFGALRLSRTVGGSGASVTQLFRLIIELAHADPHVAHLLRGHFAFVEQVLSYPVPEIRTFWANEFRRGALVGNASSELGTAGLWETNTHVEKRPDGTQVLNGIKYYTTGSIFADWVATSAAGEESTKIVVPVRRDAPGVQIIDDWDGFGQQLTGSGTATFRDVPVDPELIMPMTSPNIPYLLGYFQLYLLAVQAGIGRAVVTDAVEFVQPRTRRFGTAEAAIPRDDPLVQAVIGRISAASYAVDAVVLRAASGLDRLIRDIATDTATVAQSDVVEADIYRAQLVTNEQVLRAATDMFEVGGASATSVSRRLDRHWRNARTIANHNPAIIKEQIIGTLLLNDVPPRAAWGREVAPTDQ